MAIGKNSYGRCTLHIAILCQHEEIADFIANTFPETLRIGDNVSYLNLTVNLSYLYSHDLQKPSKLCENY